MIVKAFNKLPRSFDDFLVLFYNGSIAEFADAWRIYSPPEKIPFEIRERIMVEEEGESQRRIDRKLQKASLEYVIYPEQKKRFDRWIRFYQRLRFPVVIYRALTLPADSVEDLDRVELKGQYKGIGSSWSLNLEKAQPYYSVFGEQEGNIFLLRTEVRESDIDWEETIIANMRPEEGEYEEELKIRRGVYLHIDIKMEGDRKWVSLRDFQVRAGER